MNKNKLGALAAVLTLAAVPITIATNAGATTPPPPSKVVEQGTSGGVYPMLLTCPSHYHVTGVSSDYKGVSVSGYYQFRSVLFFVPNDGTAPQLYHAKLFCEHN